MKRNLVPTFEKWIFQTLFPWIPQNWHTQTTKNFIWRSEGNQQGKATMQDSSNLREKDGLISFRLLFFFFSIWSDSLKLMAACSRTKGVAQCVRCLLGKHEDTRVQIPNTHIQIQAWPRMLIILLLCALASQSSQPMISRFSERPCL